MKKIFIFLLILFSFSSLFFVSASSGNYIIEPNCGYQLNSFSSSDNSTVYVGGKNLCPVGSVSSTSNRYGSLAFPLNFCADSSLTFSADICIYPDDVATNYRWSYQIIYSSGSPDISSIGWGVLTNDGVTRHLSKTIITSSNRCITSISFNILDCSSPSNRHAEVTNIQLEVGSTSTSFSPYETIKEFSYPYTNLSLYDYSTIFTSTGANLDLSLNYGVYGDKRDFSVPVSLVTGWVTDFFSVVFSTWWSAVLVCLPLVYAVFCLILKIFDIRFGSFGFNVFRFIPFRNITYKPNSYSYIRFRIFHPIRYIRLHFESKGDKAVKKQLVLDELNRRSRAQRIFSIDEDIKSVRIDGKLYYNPNGVYVTYHHN